jgi:hypothetical protein
MMNMPAGWLDFMPMQGPELDKDTSARLPLPASLFTIQLKGHFDSARSLTRSRSLENRIQIACGKAHPGPQRPEQQPPQSELEHFSVFSSERD